MTVRYDNSGSTPCDSRKRISRAYVKASTIPASTATNASPPILWTAAYTTSLPHSNATNGEPPRVYEKLSVVNIARLAIIHSPSRKCRGKSPSVLSTRSPRAIGMTVTQRTKTKSKSDGWSFRRPVMGAANEQLASQRECRGAHCERWIYSGPHARYRIRHHARPGDGALVVP